MHYVCSDIHGQGKLWDELIRQLNLKEEDVLYVLGDVIDRGPDSIRILQDIMRSKSIVMFLGNHEFMMLQWLRHVKNGWMHEANGGIATKNAYLALDASLQKELREFLENAWIQKYVPVADERYALHHSSFVLSKAGEDIRYNEIRKIEVDHAVWYSPFRNDDLFVSESLYEEDGCIHIIGHVPVQMLGFEKPPLVNMSGNIINIDGGCANYLRNRPCGLYCMSLEKDEKGNRKEFWITKDDIKN